MTIAFNCPHCNHAYNIKDELAGTQARCKCGNAITIPQPQAAPAQPILAVCTQCGKQHQVPATMAGKSARCGCGGVVNIPSAMSSASAPVQTNTIFDELTDEDWTMFEGQPQTDGSFGRKSEWSVLRKYDKDLAREADKKKKLKQAKEKKKKP